MYPLPIGYKIGPKDNRADGYLIPEVRSRHTALFGKSGVGKTTLMRNMILWDIWNGSGVTVIDPHGQLIDEILEHIPRSRTNDVIYFKPADLARVGSLNILEKVPRAYQPLVVSSVVSTFKTIWANAWGPQSEYLLTNFCFALISQNEPTSLLDILRLITDQSFRAKIFSNVDDGVLQMFYRIGSPVYIPGLRINPLRLVDDTGGSMRRMARKGILQFDIRFSGAHAHQNALYFGIKWTNVYVLLEEPDPAQEAFFLQNALFSWDAASLDAADAFHGAQDQYAMIAN